MGLFRNDNKGADRWFVEMPDEAKGLLVYKWPDQQLRRKTQVTVDLDHVAVFSSSGVVKAVLGPGRHTIDDGTAPVLTAWLVDQVTSEGYYDSELYYVATKELTGVTFGGPVDKVLDPISELAVDLLVFGDCAVRVVDPSVLIANFTGTSNSTNEALESWVSSHIIASVREEAGPTIAEHGVLSLGAHQRTLEQLVAANANAELATYGLEVVRFAQLNLNVDDEDSKRLERMYEAKGYVKLAGSWEAYTVGEAMRNMGGEGGGGDGVAAAMLFSQIGSRNLGAPPAPAAPAGSPCPGCSTVNPDTSKFCSGCGGSLSCTACSARLTGTGAFCASCGAAQSPKVPSAP